MDSLRGVLSAADLEKVKSAKTSLPPIFPNNAQKVDLAVSLVGKPAFLTVEQWQRMDDVYRDFIVGATGAETGAVRDWLDHIDVFLLCNSHGPGQENCVRADMLMYYHDELVPLIDDTSWFDIILECDAVRWECIRSSEDQPLAITEALFLVGKDLWCNLNAHYWQTRFIMTKLITYYGQSNGQLPDIGLNNYIMAFVGRMLDWNVDAMIRLHVTLFKTGAGDLAVDVRGKKSQRQLGDLEKAAKSVFLDRLARMNAQEVEQNRQVLKFVCDYFCWEDDIFPGYKHKMHHRELHRNPGRKGIRSSRPQQPDPIIASPARQFIKENYEVELEAKAAEQLMDSLGALCMTDQSQLSTDHGAGDEMDVD